MRKRRARLLAILALAAAAWGWECAGLPQIRQYIRRSWTTLRRSNANLLRSAADSKVGQGDAVVLYVPAGQDPRPIAARLRKQLGPAEFARVSVRQLPATEPGLLYLPHPYVVPGGRFNEMYGWDSYFILLGLLADGEVETARGVTDNFVYEVEHYGKVLNANRTYYLARSQPPFLTQMVLEVYRRTGDLKWLAGTLPAIEKYYAYWTGPPHLTPATGLSRYYGGAGTPAPEVVQGERDRRGRSHYDRVREYFKAHAGAGESSYYDRAHDHLTPRFYLADRAMRESGFDPSGRFGPFGVDILGYNPVDLNCLLYRMEMDAAAIATLLDKPRDAAQWAGRASERAARVNRLMWNPEAGLYFDYDFERRRLSRYRFVTTFYPLWAGIASEEQAARVARNLPAFERAGGLQTSDTETGNQWDAPYGWAPMQWIAVEGLRRYGFNAAADRISGKFLAMVLRDFSEHGTIKEKYDVVTGKSDLAAGLRFGYSSNEVGFGWTNAVFLALLDQLSPAERVQLNGAVPCATQGAGSDQPRHRGAGQAQ